MRPKHLLKSTMMLILAGQMTASLATAESQPELTVYTYDSFAAEWGPAPQIKTAFEQICDCRLTFVGLDSSLGILARIRLEGDQSPADVILGLDTAQTDIARGAVSFAPHGVKNIAGKLDLPKNLPHGKTRISCRLIGDILLLFMTATPLPLRPNLWQSLSLSQRLCVLPSKMRAHLRRVLA